MPYTTTTPSWRVSYDASTWADFSAKFAAAIGEIETKQKSKPHMMDISRYTPYPNEILLLYFSDYSSKKGMYRNGKYLQEEKDGFCTTFVEVKERPIGWIGIDSHSALF